MTAPSIISSIVSSMPDDDDGRGIDDGIATAPTSARATEQPDPIRPIEYLILSNRQPERDIKHQFEIALLRKDGLQYVGDAEEWKEFEKVVALGFDIFDLIIASYWSYADATSEIFIPPKPFSWQKPYVVLVVATKDLPFSSESEMLEYFEAIPKPLDRVDGGRSTWTATRITRERAAPLDGQQLWNEVHENQQIVTCDQVRQVIINNFGPNEDTESWPGDDDPAGVVRAFDDWVMQYQAVDLADRVERWQAAGRNIALYGRLGRRCDRVAGGEKAEMLVEELVPAGMVTLLVGAPEAGKSTIAIELAVAVATAGDRWLGQKINPERAKGVAVLLSGEDTDAVINGRLEHLDPGDEAKRLVVYALDGRPLADILAEIKDMPAVSLIVVDPARRYLKGDEDGSASVDEFLAALDEIARCTGAAILVVHHLRKDANPTSLGQVREAIRGSSVFVDRPRVVLGCFRLKRENVTVVGGIKSNLPPAHPIISAIKLRRDAVTLRHVPVEPATTDGPDDGGERDELERKVVDAIARLRAQGERITRTGSRELWALRPPELDGIGRNRIREAVDRLITDGLLADGAAGIEVL